MAATLHSPHYNNFSFFFFLSLCQLSMPPLTYHPIISSASSSSYQTLAQAVTMALQAPSVTSSIPSSLAPSGNAGLRRNSDAFALKSSFFSPSVHLLLSPGSPGTTVRTAPKFSMRVASKQAYICRDCGYIYNDKKPFDKQPDSYFCPVCGAPKRRFKTYEPKVTKNANDLDVRKARKAELKRDEAVGKALPIGIAVGIVVLAALYFYLNSTY